MGKKSTKIDMATAPSSLPKKDPKATNATQDNHVQKIAAKTNKRMYRAA